MMDNWRSSSMISSEAESQPTSGNPARYGRRLEADEVHVWSIDLGLSHIHTPELMQILSADERERADSFQFSLHRDRYVLGRSSMRRLLARYLGVGASEVPLTYGENGKPALRTSGMRFNLGFNMAHSHKLGVLAIAWGVPVGIDIEYRHRRLIERDLAGRFFSPLEVAMLDALPEADRERGFYNCWVRKEAYLKARGDGLSFPLDAFSVSLTPGRPPLLLENKLAPGDPERWRLHSLALEDGYTGALTLPAKQWRLRYFRLEE